MNKEPIIFITKPEKQLKEKDNLEIEINNYDNSHLYYKGFDLGTFKEIANLRQENQKYKEVIFKIKMIISARIKEYQKKIDNEIDMGSQGDHFKICRYEENIKFLKDILKEVK